MEQAGVRIPSQLRQSDFLFPRINRSMVPHINQQGWNSSYGSSAYQVLLLRRIPRQVPHITTIAPT